MITKNTRDRIIFILLVLAFRVSLDIFYIAYQPALEVKWLFQYNLRNGFEIFMSYFLLIIVSIVMPIYTDRPSKFVLFILFLFSYMSASSFIMFNNQIDFSPFSVLTTFFIIMSLLLRDKVTGDIQLNIKDSNIQGKNAMLIILIFIALLTVIQVATFGFKLQPPNLLEVYDIREEYKTAAGRFSGYATTWTANVFTAFLFAYGIIYKKFLFTVSALVLVIYIYSITGMKSTIFSLAFVSLVLFSYKVFKKRMILFLVGFFLFANTMILLFLENEKVWMTGILFTRRLFMVTAQLFFFYTDYVKTHTYDFFAQNFPFSLFMTSDYDKNIPYIIGDEIYNMPKLAANANIFADFYFNIGPFGLLILAFIFYWILKLADALARGKNNALVFSLFIMPTLAMTNGAFLTSLLTHGFLIAIVVLYFYQEPKSSNSSVSFKMSK